jgi:hypothetical protein
MTPLLLGANTARPGGMCPSNVNVIIAAGHNLCYAPGRNRTCDLALRRRTLYPLSYRREP